MELWKDLLLLIAAVAALVLLCLVILWFEKKVPGEVYDERQKQSRGNAYRAAFWTGAIYFIGFGAGLLPGKDWFPAEEHFLIVYIGLILQLLVFHIYCLLTGAALPLGYRKENIILTMISYGMFGTFSMLDYLLYRTTPELIAKSTIQMKLINAVTFFSLMVMHLIRMFWKEKE